MNGKNKTTIANKIKFDHSKEYFTPYFTPATSVPMTPGGLKWLCRTPFPGAIHMITNPMIDAASEAAGSHDFLFTTNITVNKTKVSINITIYIF